MKKFLLSLFVFQVLFIIGCQENPITDPNPILTKDDKPAGTITSGTIPLKGILVFPGPFNSFYSISGEIHYTHELARMEKTSPRNNVSLKLIIKADLYDVNSQKNYSWTISGESEANFYVSEDGIKLFEKSFTVQGRKDGLKLVCRFLATTDGLGLNEMWLSVQDDQIHTVKKDTAPKDTVTYPPVKISRAQ